MRSTSTSAGAPLAVLREVVAAAAGDGAAPAGAAVVAAAVASDCLEGTATASAVALDVATVDSEPQATCLPVTGRRPSVSPVSVAITSLG